MTLTLPRRAVVDPDELPATVSAAPASSATVSDASASPSGPEQEWLRKLNWGLFETLVESAFSRDGFQVLPAPERVSGQADMLLERQGEQYLVQCKHWKAWQVGTPAVAELRALVDEHGFGNGLLITAGKFSPEATELAQESGLLLLDGNDVLRMASGSPVLPLADETISQWALPKGWTAYGAPTCPLCESPMLYKRVRGGEHAGMRFWGCRHYPACRAIREVGPSYLGLPLERPAPEADPAPSAPVDVAEPTPEAVVEGGQVDEAVATLIPPTQGLPTAPMMTAMSTPLLPMPVAPLVEPTAPDDAAPEPVADVGVLLPSAPMVAPGAPVPVVLPSLPAPGVQALVASESGAPELTDAVAEQPLAASVAEPALVAPPLPEPIMPEPELAAPVPVAPPAVPLMAAVPAEPVLVAPPVQMAEPVHDAPPVQMAEPVHDVPPAQGVVAGGSPGAPAPSDLTIPVAPEDLSAEIQSPAWGGPEGEPVLEPLEPPTGVSAVEGATDIAAPAVVAEREPSEPLLPPLIPPGGEDSYAILLAHPTWADPRDEEDVPSFVPEEHSPYQWPTSADLVEDDRAPIAWPESAPEPVTEVVEYEPEPAPSRRRHFVMIGAVLAIAAALTVGVAVLIPAVMSAMKLILH